MAALGAVAFDFTMGRERRFHVASILGQIPKFGIVLGALEFGDRKETDFLQLMGRVARG